MNKIIVTSGGKYSDIDTLACGFAYNRILELLNITTRLILLGPVNESVSKTVRTWNYTFESTFEGSADGYKFVLVDISDPEYFADFVIPKQIIEIYDHRWGFEKIWKQKLGTGAKIEIVGSCATLIWEEYKKRGVANRIDEVSANLLYTAILSNTLNFYAQITTQRDKNATTELLKYTNLPSNWNGLYFSEIEKALMDSPLKAIENGTKETTINNLKYKIAQLELWDNTSFIEKNLELFQSWLIDSTEKAFITIPNISKGINHIFCSDNDTQNKLSRAVSADFKGNFGITDKLWLRKEIIRELELLN